MMDMTSGIHGMLILLVILHFLAALAVATGLIFCILWGAKRLTEAELKRWGLILLGVGILVGAAVAAFGGLGMQHWKGERGMMAKKMGMMEMQDRNQKSAPGSHEAMTMDDMVTMLQGKMGDDFDHAFLKGMIEHHQGAIEMAELAQNAAGHQEIKDMSADIIAAQKAEIETMRKWAQEWNYGMTE